MTTHEGEIHDGQFLNPDAAALALRMRGRVGHARVTFYPGIALPHIELWTERAPHYASDPGGPPAYNYFNAFAPVRQDQTDDEWLAVMLSGDSTVLQPVPPTTEKEEVPE